MTELQSEKFELFDPSPIEPFNSGVDPHSSDRFGKLEVSSAGLKRRNALVYRMAALHRSRLVVPRASF